MKTYRMIMFEADAGSQRISVDAESIDEAIRKGIREAKDIGFKNPRCSIKSIS